LSLIKASGHYECFNPKCRHSFLPIEIEKYNRQIEEDKRALDEIPTTGNGPWVGNQYFDAKKKKWMDGDKPKRVHLIPIWLLVLVGFVIISIVVTLILNHLQPGSRAARFCG
jgi:hypothetical protein